MKRQTRRRGKERRQTRKHTSYKNVQHHHLLLRIEMQRCPGSTDADKKQAELLLQRIIHDIHMKPLDAPHVYYVKRPYFNEGMTAIMPIQTSHIAFHFWKNPEPVILKGSRSRCLLEMDVYTCGSLTATQMRRILHHLSPFKPTRADLTLLNRKWSLTIDRHAHWCEDTSRSVSWSQWVDSVV